MAEWKTSSKFSRVEGGGWTMWRVVIENHGSNPGDKPTLQLMLGKWEKKGNGQKKIRTRKVSKRNVTMPPLVLLISMSTQISLKMVDAGDSSGRGELETPALLAERRGQPRSRPAARSPPSAVFGCRATSPIPWARA